MSDLDLSHIGKNMIHILTDFELHLEGKVEVDRDFARIGTRVRVTTDRGPVEVFVTDAEVVAEQSNLLSLAADKIIKEWESRGG